MYGDSKWKVWKSDIRCKSTAHCECSTNGSSAFEQFDFRHKGSSDRDSEDFTDVARKSLEEQKSGNFNKIWSSVQESEEFGDNKDSYWMSNTWRERSAVYKRKTFKRDKFLVLKYRKFFRDVLRWLSYIWLFSLWLY